MYSEKMGSMQSEIIGPSLDACKETLYRKYGNNYQITNFTTHLKGGFLGFGQKETVKVSYIVNSRQTEVRQSSSAASYARNDADSFTKNRDEILKKTDSSVTNTLQLAKIQETLDKLSNNMVDLQNNASRKESDKHESIVKIEEILASNEFTPSYIRTITEKIRSEFSLEDLADFDKVEKAVVDWIGESIHVADETVFRAPHVIVIIGPTGVGKTTTVAKIAANGVLSAKKSGRSVPDVRMVTIDKMRVGAAEQLKRYGEIMHVPVDKAEDAGDLKQIFTDYKDHLDQLLIDTSGFSPNDYDNIAKMRGMLDVPGLKPDVYLAVSASTKAKDLENIMRNYESFNFRSVIITKCDETSSIGNVLSVLSEKNKTISWITNGQQVPRFIEKATKMYFLMNLEGFNIDRQHLEDKFGSAKEDR